MTSASSGHAVKPPFRCGFCDRQFSSFNFLTEHKMRQKNHLYCRRCNLDFSSPAQYHQHLDAPLKIISTEDGGARCLRCNVDHETISDFDSHFSGRHPYGCKDCRLDFHNSRALQKHLGTAHGDISSPSTQNAYIEQVEPSRDPSTDLMEVQDAASEPIPEPPQPTKAASAPVDERPPPQREQSNDRGVHPLPARPPASVQGSFARRRFFYCDTCNNRFTTLPELKRHLDKSTSLFDRYSTPEGGVFCIGCRTTFSSADEFKLHIQNLDESHQFCLHKWCIPCFLKFHTRTGLVKHNEFVHGLRPQGTSAEEGTSALPSTQSTFPTPDAGPDGSEQNAHDDAPGPIAPAEARDLARPIDLLFASIIRDASITPLEAPAVSETPPPVETPPTQQVSSDTIQPAPSPGSSAPAPTPTPPVTSTRDRRPYRSQASARPDRRFCHRCQQTFSNSQELNEHYQNGMPAIVPDQNNEETLVCAQCKESFQDIDAMKNHLRSHEATCIACLLHFHGSRRLHEHRQLLHSTSAVTQGGGTANEETQPQPTNMTTRPPAEPHPATPVAEPSDSSFPLVPPEPRPTVRGPQPVPRNHRTVRQISLQDFSDTDDDDNPSEIDNSQLGGWQETNPQGQRRPDADAYSVRTGGNVLGRNARSGGRRPTAEQRWWWEGQPPATSWDALASGRISQDPHSIELATSSKSNGLHPKVPRISSVAISCSVCLEEAAVDLTSTPCGHVGCEACLRKAVKAKPECPICRKPTRLSDLRPLFL